MTADVVLAMPVVPSYESWSMMFPQARILVTEILDDDLGLDVRDGSDDSSTQERMPAYRVVPSSKFAQNVRGYLASQGQLELPTSDENVLGNGPPDQA